MPSLNKVFLMGNAGKDAELRYTPTGSAVASFSLAVNSGTKNASGGWDNHTEWFNIVVFRDQAERVSQKVRKGTSVFVEGRFQTRSWEDDKGKHSRPEVIANSVMVLKGEEHERPKEDDFDDLPFD